MGAKSSRLKSKEIDILSRETHFSNEPHLQPKIIQKNMSPIKVRQKFCTGMTDSCATALLENFRYRSLCASTWNFSHMVIRKNSQSEKICTKNVTKFRFVFLVFDTDNDGSIGFQEFIQAVSITSHGSLDFKLEWAFRIYDLDNNGQITKTEMLRIIRAISSMISPLIAYFA